jgi:hypothetical protein
MIKILPNNGKTRKRKSFLFKPVVIGKIQKWLEWARWEETYDEKLNRWVPKKWIEGMNAISFSDQRRFSQPFFMEKDFAFMNILSNNWRLELIKSKTIEMLIDQEFRWGRT